LPRSPTRLQPGYVRRSDCVAASLVDPLLVDNLDLLDVVDLGICARR
jgi:hypothetical protein